MNHVYAVILAGGKSSRLFPFNKVLSDLTGSGRSLIQQAYDRVSIIPEKNRYVLTVKAMVSPTRRQIKLPASHFLTDPARRGTWPALMWAMAHLRLKDPTAVIAVVTGDHVIPKVKEFQRAFTQAVRTARAENSIVVIPVRPSSVAQEWTSFGAVSGDGAIGRWGEGAIRIVGFEEKPTMVRARQMIHEGGWFWNAGMFFFRISVAEQALRIYQPKMSQIYEGMAEALVHGKMSVAVKMFEAFPEKIVHPLDPQRMADNSIDYAIMSPLVHSTTTVASAWMTRQALTDWKDLGQWTALRQVVKPDRHGNIKIGDVRLGSDVRNSILVAEHGHRIDISAVEGLIVALAGHQALILQESQVGRVKEWVAAAKKNQPIIGQTPQIDSFALSKRKNIVILSNTSPEAI